MASHRQRREAEATIRALANIERPSERHLYWPDLDVDLTLNSIEYPSDYPLVSKATPRAPATLEPPAHRPKVRTSWAGSETARAVDELGPLTSFLKVLRLVPGPHSAGSTALSAGRSALSPGGRR